MTKPRKPTVVRSLVKFSLLLLLLCSAYLYTLTLAPSSQHPAQTFTIAKGESVKSVATRLAEASLIRSPLFFRLIVRTKQLVIQAGTYELAANQTPIVLAQQLTKRLATDIKLTIPEGYRLEQIAETAQLPTKDFLAAAKGLEGQLFPDTYFIKPGISSAELVKIMHANFLSKVTQVDHDTLILASLIERETRGDAEKPIVAGILQKRLSAGWSLELDATVQYFLGKPGDWWPNTTLLDRKLKSSYNTYLNVGLPPAPICNPGLASIKAAQNPVSSSYWFYLHDREGHIHYGATLEEHNQNIAKYIK